jgi:argininosuccinate synthase
MSVRSTNQAASVPTTAQRNVTTSVRLTVFHNNWAVRLRKSRGSSVPQPTCAACTTRKTMGRMTATATMRATSTSRCGRWRRRSGW